MGSGLYQPSARRHIPGGTGAGAFRHLNHVHWNFMLMAPSYLAHG